MKVHFKAPSKTFLLGEYLALDGGLSVLFNTSPYFEFNIDIHGQGLVTDVHRMSPAGQFMRDYSHNFQRLNAEFIDPHLGKGGLGASSSQFLFVYLWQQLGANQLLQERRDLLLEKLWSDYKKYAWDGKGRAPSGADVMAQFTGKITVFATDPLSVHSLDWPFADKSFVILRTGHKVPTHKHLHGLQLPSTEGLKKWTETGVEALTLGDWNLFLESINAFSQELQDLNLTCNTSKELLESWQESGLVDAKKACGALGADTLLLFFDKGKKQEIVELAKEMNLDVVATEEQLAHGFSMNLDFTGQQAHV